MTTKVTAQMSVSLDGFYTGPRDTRDPKDMRGWMEGPEALGLGAGEGIELVPTRVVAAPAVTHIRYTVSGRSQLVLDDRGASGALVGAAQERSEL